MVLTNAIRARLASALRPWLREEANIELNLGFFHSHICVENLVFDVAVLNQATDESNQFCFKHAKVRILKIRISPWSVPALTVEVSGADATLGLRESRDPGSSRERPSSDDTSCVKTKKMLALLDPEGSSLHEAIEKTFATASSRNWSILTANVILRLCQLKLLQINFELQLLNPDASACYFLKSDLVCAQGVHMSTSLFKGLISAVFTSQAESSFIVTGSGVEIGLKKKNHVNVLASVKDILTSARFNYLQLVELGVQMPQIDFMIQPSVLPEFILASRVLGRKQVKGLRSGLELWRIAARKIGYLSSCPCFSWYILVKVILLWLKYIKAYELLLLLVGYSADGGFSINISRTVQDTMFVRRLKNQWKLVSKIEKELPVEAVACARRISRDRAVLHLQASKSEPIFSVQVTARRRFLNSFSLIWKVLYFVLQSMICLLCVPIKRFLGHSLEVADMSAFAAKECFSAHCLRLNLNVICINMYLLQSVQHPVYKNVVSDINISHLNVISFCLVVKALCLSYIDDYRAQTFSVACGNVKVLPLPSIVRSLRNVPESEINALLKGPDLDKDNGSKTIAWTESAPKFNLPETVGYTETLDDSSFDILLEKYLGEMWSDWMSKKKKFDGNNIEYLEHPFLLCEIKSFIMDPYIDAPKHGLSVGNLALGKLNVVLDYLSIVSVYWLFRQSQDACDCNYMTTVQNGVSCLLDVCEEKEEFQLKDFGDYVVSKLKIMSHSLIPERNIHVGLAMLCPTIQVAMLQEQLAGLNAKSVHPIAPEHGNYFTTFDLGKIEAAVWPASRTTLSALTGLHTLQEETDEHLWLEKPPQADIPKENFNEKYRSEGLTALDACVRVNGMNIHCEDLKKGQRLQVFGPLSASFQSSFFRESLHSLESVNALSVALTGTVEGLIFLSYADELWTFFQVLESVLSVSQAASTLNSHGNYHGEDFRSVAMPSPSKDIYGYSVWRFEDTKFTLDASVDLKPLSLVMDKSRKIGKEEYYRKDDGASASTSQNTLFPMENSVKSMLDVLEYGILLSAKESSVQVCIKEGLVEVRLESTGFDAVIFQYGNSTKSCSQESEFENLLHHPLKCLSAFAVSNFSFRLCTALHGESLPSDGDHLNIFADDTEVKQGNSSQRLRHAASNLEHSPTCWVLLKIGLGNISIAEPSLKGDLLNSRQFSNHLFSLAIGQDFHEVSCETQGGCIILEAAALSTFLRCFNAYLLGIKSLFSSILFKKQSESVEILVDNNLPFKRKWKFPDSLILKCSDIGFLLATADGSGGACGIRLQFDILLKLKSQNSRPRLLLDIPRVTLYSQCFPHGCCSGQEATTSHGPHFLSSGSRDLARREESGMSEFERSVSGHYILKHGLASIMVEKIQLGSEAGTVFVKNDWIGSGSISRFELTVTLSDIRMLLDLTESMSVLSGANTGHDFKPERNHPSADYRHYDDLETTVPDGSVVAIKDLQQHMYFAVEAVQNKYRLVGTVHYSLVGERALFKVRYHKQRKWRSQISWFTLISLFAKNEKGEPLRLSFCPGSAFVNISCSDNKEWASWQAIPYDSNSYTVDNNQKLYDESSKRAVSLLNQKSHYAVAFIDGLPQFVRKPGNPFKMKVFGEFSSSQMLAGVSASSACVHKTHETTGVNREEACLPSMDFPQVVLTIDEVILTICDEVSESDKIYPLLQICINNFQPILQVSSSKVRCISPLTAACYYFNARMDSWKEFVSPIEMCLFYRTKFASSPDDVQSRPLTCYYLSARQANMSLTELSLDVILFVLGKVDLAGPFAVKLSDIFANCCKVENNSGVTLICSFDDDKDAVVSGRNSTSIRLKHAVLADQSQGNTSLMSLRLAVLGMCATLPIHVSLLNAQTLAWRTRIESLKDSRTFPGPFIVVDVSEKTEEGMSISISPMFRIHNGSGFSMEVRFSRPQETEAQSASAMLQSGDIIDDSVAVFDALSLSGGSRKALMSLTLGNFVLSFRPNISGCFQESVEQASVEWSEEMKGGKAIRLSGIFEKLNFRAKKAFGMARVKSSLSSTFCAVNLGGQSVTKLHFLIQTISRDVPVRQPQNMGDTSEKRSLPFTLQEQKETFLLPTVQVFNLLQLGILVILTESYPDSTVEVLELIGKRATIPCGSSAYFYANPAMIYFTVTLPSFNLQSKPVNSRDWIRKLNKERSEAHYLDVELDFGGGKCFTFLRLSRGDKGILEATVYTSYVLQNGTDFSLFCFPANQKPPSWAEVLKCGSSLPPQFGYILPPNSTKSWFHKSNKVYLKWMEEKAPPTLLDLDMLSGFTELGLGVQEMAGARQVAKLGMCLKSCLSKIVVPCHIVSIAPRYVIVNESHEDIIVQQCYFEDYVGGTVNIKSHEHVAVPVRLDTCKRRELSLFDSLLKKHRDKCDDSLVLFRFCLKDSGWSWSSPICIASLGRFFLKFKNQLVDIIGQSNTGATTQEKNVRYATLHTVEEGSSLVLHFDMPSNLILPYRIENYLSQASITYYQKDSTEAKVLGSGNSVEYVWDDLTLPRKLIVLLSDIQLSREINIDKMCQWRPFLKSRQMRGLPLHVPFEKKSVGRRGTSVGSRELEMLKIGYEVYADGLTRVLRICGPPDDGKEEKMAELQTKIQIRVSFLSIQLLEGNRDFEGQTGSSYSPVIVARFEYFTLDLNFIDQYKFNQLKIQSLTVDEKWQGAPFGAMVRRHQIDSDDMNENLLHVVFNLHSTGSKVKQVKFASIILQPLDLNVDEETLMRLVAFWRTSLADSTTPSKQFYFKHFEIHPIKIVASFLPGNPNSSYSSAQETLRSLLHSVIKVPAVKNMVVELNGVLLTHALVTTRELLIKCAQHYSWYIMRAIYIAKGSTLLPPAFASIFDDAASSSLDAFFDPSSGLVNLPGLTLGMFKFISKCIDTKGFSGTKRYFGDLGKTMKTAGSNVLFAAITEISDSVLKGAEASGFNGMVNGFHQGILKLAMEPSFLGSAVMEGGPDRKIKLERSPGIDELYIEGYLQAMLDVIYKQEYLRVRVIEDQVILKNLPPNSSIINEIMEHVKSFLVSKALLKGEPSMISNHNLRHIRGESDWKVWPTVLTLCEHLFVSFAIRTLRKRAAQMVSVIDHKRKAKAKDAAKDIIPPLSQGWTFGRKWGITKFVLSGMVAYVDGRLCRHISHPIARRIVSGFLLSFLEKDDNG